MLILANQRQTWFSLLIFFSSLSSAAVHHGAVAMSRVRGIAIACGLLATIASTLRVYPHQLAYFNELAGGPENGHKHLLHSNLDWGQDLLFVKKWMDGRELQPCHVQFISYFPYPLEGLLSDGGSRADWKIVSTTKVFGLGSHWTSLGSSCTCAGTYTVRAYSNAVFHLEGQVP